MSKGKPATASLPRELVGYLLLTHPQEKGIHAVPLFLLGQTYAATEDGIVFVHGHRGASRQDESRPPVGTHSELWSYEVEVTAPRPPARR